MPESTHTYPGKTAEPTTGPNTVPAYLLAATKDVLADRERELLKLKGPCSNRRCRLHYAHSGPCDQREPGPGSDEIARIEPCCDMHNLHCEPPGDLCCERCAEAAHDSFPVRHADGSVCILGGPQ